jgi:hypothetical protein
MADQLEFKVLDNNADFMGILFPEESAAAPAVPPVPAAPLAPVTQAPVASTQQAPANEPPKQPVLNPSDVITNDDLLGLIVGTKTDEASVTETGNQVEGAQQQSPQKPSVNESLDSDEMKLRNKIYAEHLIEQGIWQPIDGIDEIDFTVENLKKIVDIQTGLNTQAVVTTQWDALKKSSKYIETIFDYVENDRDPSEIIGLFQQQQEVVNSLDFESVDGTVEAIRKFYTEKSSPKWDMAKTNRYIKNLELEGEDAVRSEGKFVQEQFGEVFEQERQAKVKAIEEDVKRKEEDRKVEIRNNYNVLKNQGFDDKNAQRLLTDIYQPKHPKNGSNTMMTELEIKLEEIKSDPESFLEYAQFVLNKENYKKSLTTKEITNVTNDIWNKLKTGVKTNAENVTVSQGKVQGGGNIYEQLIAKK